MTNKQGVHSIEKRSLPLFMLPFSNEEKVEKVYSIKSILGIIVKIEPLKKNINAIIQCKRCQAFGHTKTYCNNNPACVKCAGKHLTNDCTMGKDQNAKCVNCTENHPASYRGCIIAVEQQKRKSSLLRTQHQKQRQTQKVDNKESAGQSAIGGTNKVNYQNTHADVTNTYSQIVKNVRQQEETSVRELLNTIIQRLNDQDQSIKGISNKVFQKIKEQDLSQRIRQNV